MDCKRAFYQEERYLLSVEVEGFVLICAHNRDLCLTVDFSIIYNDFEADR